MSHQAEPGVIDVVQSRFPESRHIRHLRDSLRSCRRNRTHLPGLSHLLREIERREIHLHIAAHDCGDGIRRALERHVHDVHRCCVAEQCGGDERRAGRTWRGEIERARSRFRQLDHLLEILRRNLGIDDEVQRRRAYARNTGKILDWIEREILVHQPCDGMAVGGQHQGVAIRDRLRDGKRAGNAGPVLHDHLLTPAFGGFIGNNSRHDVGYASRAEWHHDGDPLARKTLPPAACRGCE